MDSYITNPCSPIFVVVVIGGPGLEPGVKAGLPADIDIDATKAGDAPLEVEVLNPQNRKVKVEVDEEEPGIFAATYYPDKPGLNTIYIACVFAYLLWLCQASLHN